MTLNRIWLGSSLMIVTFSLALSAQAQIGVYGADTITESSKCAYPHGAEITSIKDILTDANGDSSLYTNAALGTNNDGAITKKGFCNTIDLKPIGNNGEFYKIYKKNWIDFTADGKVYPLSNFTLDSASYYDITNPLYYMWQCCDSAGQNCEYCAAKIKPLICGNYIAWNNQTPTEKQLCPGGRLLSGPTESPVGSGKYTWGCSSKDSRPGQLSTPLQSITCNSQPSSTGCGNGLNGNVPTSDIINDWPNITPAPCPPGSIMINTTIQPQAEPNNPYTATIYRNQYDIQLSDGTTLQRPKPCSITTMTWQCYNLSNGDISSCASACLDTEATTPSIIQSTGTTVSNTNNNTAVATIFNQILSILANITAELAKLKM